VSALDHLDEAASIVALERHGTAWGGGRLVSDDRGARDKARRRGLAAESTVGIVAKLLALSPAPLAIEQVDMKVLRSRERMRARLTASHLLAGELDSWQYSVDSATSRDTVVTREVG
jgi:hypothetical protein